MPIIIKNETLKFFVSRYLINIVRDLVSPYKPKQYIRDIFEGQIVSILGGILAGTILASRIENLQFLPGFFILLPGFLELQGCINSTLAARTGSLVHTKGVEKADGLKDYYVKVNLFSSFILSVVSSLILGIFILFLTLLILKKLVLQLVLVSFLSSLIVSLILIPLTLASSVWLYKRGYDPDNIMGAFLTSVTDIVSVIVLILVIKTIF